MTRVTILQLDQFLKLLGISSYDTLNVIILWMGIMYEQHLYNTFQPDWQSHAMHCGPSWTVEEQLVRWLRMQLLHLLLPSSTFPFVATDPQISKQKSNNSTPADLRLISLLPILSKLLEKHLHLLMSDHISNYCPGFQRGYSGTSCDY